MIKHFLNAIILLMILTSCSSEVSLDDVRESIEKTDSLVVDYKFCAYQKNELQMQNKMYNYIVRKDDNNLFRYFRTKNIYDKKMIAKIVCRYLCREHEYFNRPSNRLTQKVFFELLDDCTTEIADDYFR